MFFQYFSKNWFSMTQRFEFFLRRKELNLFVRLKELNPFSLNMTQRIEPFFFEYDAKNWTFLCDAKNFFFFC